MNKKTTAPTARFECPFCHATAEGPVPIGDLKITIEHRCPVARKFVRMDRREVH